MDVWKGQKSCRACHVRAFVQFDTGNRSHFLSIIRAIAFRLLNY